MTLLNRARAAADTIPDESGVQPVPMDPADRKRVQNLLGGRFLESYEHELASHHRNKLLPNDDDLVRGISPFPSVLEAVYSFSNDELADATRLLNPTLLLYPPNKTRSDLIKLLSPTARARTSLMKMLSSPDLKGDLRTAIFDSESVDIDPESRYRAYIVDGLPEMDLFRGDVPSHSYLTRKDIFGSLHAFSGYAMTADLYTLLSHQFAARGEVIDQTTCTLLNGEDEMEISEYNGIDLVFGSRRATVLFDKVTESEDSLYYVPIGRFHGGRPSIELIADEEDDEEEEKKVESESKLDLTCGRFRRVLGGNLVPRQR